MKNRRELTQEELADAARLKSIYERRKALLKGVGEKLTQEDVASLCGWSGQSAFSQYASGRVPLNVTALLKLSRVLGFELEEVSPRIAAQVKSIESDPTHVAWVIGRDDSSDNAEPGPQMLAMFRPVKIIGTAQLGPDGYWSAIDEGDGYIDVPCRDPDAYAMRLKGDSMAPAIRNGWIALCEPNHQLIPGEYVMLRLVSGESMVKELLYENAREVSVMSVNTAYGDRRTIPIEEVEQIHYVGGIFPPGKVRS
ncbi:LexA family transcriptional regulator [Pseudomonas reactans]